MLRLVRQVCFPLVRPRQHAQTIGTTATTGYRHPLLIRWCCGRLRAALRSSLSLSPPPLSIARSLSISPPLSPTHWPSSKGCGSDQQYFMTSLPFSGTPSLSSITLWERRDFPFPLATLSAESGDMRIVSLSIGGGARFFLIYSTYPLDRWTMWRALRACVNIPSSTKCRRSWWRIWMTFWMRRFWRKCSRIGWVCALLLCKFVFFLTIFFSDGHPVFWRSSCSVVLPSRLGSFEICHIWWITFISFVCIHNYRGDWIDDFGHWKRHACGSDVLPIRSSHTIRFVFEWCLLQLEQIGIEIGHGNFQVIVFKFRPSTVVSHLMLLKKRSNTTAPTPLLWTRCVATPRAQLRMWGIWQSFSIEVLTLCKGAPREYRYFEEYFCCKFLKNNVRNQSRSFTAPNILK